MSRCKATLKFKVTTNGPEMEIACDLDENHLPIYGRHFDKTIGPTGLEWLPGAKPTAVMATRTTPNPSKPARAQKQSTAVRSAGVHTGVFEIINVE